MWMQNIQIFGVLFRIWIDKLYLIYFITGANNRPRSFLLKSGE